MTTDHGRDEDDLLSMLERLKAQAKNKEGDQDSEATAEEKTESSTGDAEKVDELIQTSSEPPEAEPQTRQSAENPVVEKPEEKGEFIRPEQWSSLTESPDSDTQEIPRSVLKGELKLPDEAPKVVDSSKAPPKFATQPAKESKEEDTPKTKDKSETESLVSPRPERYNNPTRSIPLGPESDSPRVVSSSNLVGAPPPKPGKSSTRSKVASGARYVKEVLVLFIVLALILVALVYAFWSFKDDIVIGENKIPDSKKRAMAGSAGSGESSQDWTYNQDDRKASLKIKTTSPEPMASVKKALQPQFAIKLLETTDMQEYEEMLAKLQKDNFRVSVEVLDSGQKFVVQILEVTQQSLEDTLARLESLEYLEKGSFNVEPVSTRLAVDDFAS